MSKKLSEQIMEFTISSVFGNDIFPRLSMYCI